MFLSGVVRRATARRAYHAESAIGQGSANPWIDRSSTIKGWLHEGEPEFLWELAMRPVGGDVVEVGAWEGKSTCILAGACLTRGDASRVVAIDTFLMDGSSRQHDYYRALRPRHPGTFYEFMGNARRLRYDSAVVPVAIESGKADHMLAGLRIRMAFIDGRHDFEGVANDIRLALPLLAPGGVLAFHDVGERYPGIRQAIDQHLGDGSGVTPIGLRHCLAAFAIRAAA